MALHSPSSEPLLSQLPARPAWDRIGIGLSGLCAAHCLLTPFLLAALPFWPMLGTAHTWLHPALVALLLPVTGFAAWDAYRHGGTSIPLLLGLGFVLIAGAWLGHDVWGAIGEAAGTLVGSGLLITGHLINWRRHRAARTPATSRPRSSAPA